MDMQILSGKIKVMYILILVFALLFLLVLIKVILDIRERFIPEYLHHKSKCISCENDIISRYGVQSAWRANPTKGFDDEKEAVLQAGGDISGGFLAKTIKYY